MINKYCCGGVAVVEASSGWVKWVKVEGEREGVVKQCLTMRYL